MSAITETSVLQALKQVIDPEIDCNIVDLGLIYSVEIRQPRVTIKMTLTTPGCPMSDRIAWAVKTVLLGLDGVEDAEVELVWDPPWHPSLMTKEGQERIGARI